MNQNISIKLRMRFFDACVTPTVLFGLTTLHLTMKHYRDIDILQRKMMRSIIDWRFYDTDNWEDVMRRMILQIYQT